MDWLFPKRKKENFEVGPVVIMDDDGGSPIPWLGPIGAGSIPNGPLHDASKNFHRLSSNLPMTIVQGALRKFKSTLNKNNDDAESHFVIYKITFDGEVYKFGKADYERITKESGYPTRLHQQLRTLRKDNPNVSIQAEIVEDLGITTTEFAKKIENDYLQRYWDIYKIVPEGNRKSFKPK